MRFLLAHLIGKLSYFCLKILGRNATYLPGYLILKIDKNYLKKLKIKSKILAVTGTNGKTTTSNLIYDFLKNENYFVINNSFGSNTEEGIVSLLMKWATFKKVKVDYIVLEVDERSAIHIFSKLTPDYLLVTNIFRDSYSRNAHPDFIIDILNRAIPKETTLILNADDLLSCMIKPDNKRIYYSFKKEIKHLDYQSNVIDIVNCPNCQHLLKVDYRRYHHIGRYHCDNCGFNSFDGDFELVEINENMNTIKIKENNNIYEVNAISLREVDLYNQLSSFSLLKTLGFNLEQLQKGYEKLKVVSSRFNIENVKGLTIISSLAKGLNPVATSRVFDYIIQENKKCSIILVQSETGFITTGDYDDSKNNTSESIGWLYEIDFELLKNDCLDKIVIGGKRTLDYQVRCQIAGIAKDKILTYRNPLRCYEGIDLNKVDVVYILFDIHNKSFADYNLKQIKKRLENEG